jgi:hypothetical protein
VAFDMYSRYLGSFRERIAKAEQQFKMEEV